MTTRPPDPPAQEPPAGPPPEAPPGAPGAPGAQDKPPRRRRHLVRSLAFTFGSAMLLVAFVAALLYGAFMTERGTRYAWQTAVTLLDGRLAGEIDGGTIATGIKLRNVAWHGGDGTSLTVDRVAGEWQLSSKPWRFVVEYLHVGNVDVRIVPSTTPSKPLALPQDLRLPLALDVRDLQVARLTVHEGTSTTELSRFLFHGRSDGRHHEAAIERLDTPYGAVTASAKLDGVRAFPLSGELGYAGKVNDEAVQVNAVLGGSLEALTAEVEASGMKLTGHAHVEATPFAAVPLQRVTLAFDHVNPQAFAPGAPFADLALRAQLEPVAAGAAGAAASATGSSAASATAFATASAAASARTPASASATTAASASASTAAHTTPHTAHSAAKPAPSPGFAARGNVSITNAKPGAIDAHLLPLIDAHADVVLDAKTQRIANLNVRLVKNATVTGGGVLAGKRGSFDLKVAGLDLNALEAAVRPTSLSGPIGIRLNDDVQSVTLDLADPKAALRAQGKVTLDPARISFNDVRISSGAGRLDLTGALKHDANSTYTLKASLVDFDPLSLTSQTPSRSAVPAKQARAAPAAAASTASQTPNAGKTRQTAPSAKAPAKAPVRRIEARVNGTLAASGVLAPTFTTKADFKLGESVYNDLPLTGAGTIQLAGSRILPSRANLSIAGNTVDLQGSFGARGDRLRFRVDAPQLERLGFGIAGQLAANGDLTGTFAHPDVELDYKADSVVFGSTRLGHAEGRAEARDGANGALAFSTDARDLSAAGVELATLSARLTGTRAKHELVASAAGKLQGQPLALKLAANGKLTDSPAGTRWDGTITELQNSGAPDVKLQSPLTVSAGADKVTLGATRLALEGATLDLKSFDLDHGRIHSTGSLTAVSLARLMALRQRFTGTPSTLKTDLVFDGDWDFNVGQSASGYAQIKRRSGDITVEVGRGMAPLGIADLVARAQFSAGNHLEVSAHAQASRIGVLDLDARTALAPRDGILALADDAPLAGTLKAEVPSLRTTGGLLGPSYLLDGHLALQLALEGTLGKPNVSGSLTGDGLSATVVDQGIQLKDGVVRVALSHNLVDFQQVEFHGASGTLRATGRVRLDNDEPDLTASIVADKLELFASPERKLSLSGSASIANGGHLGGMQITGKFTVDRALFDMPEQAAPELGDDVVIVRPDGTTMGGTPQLAAATDKPAVRFSPRANIEIDLGHDFRFRGQGADLGLAGTITATSEPGVPLRAVGNVRVTEGSTYTAFGRKLSIENGFFTFNGPVANPGINILAMRRNQEVEAGVQVTGTVQAPVAKLISEPNVPDNEKLSWLLFGHGTDQGNNVGQQSAMTTALALLGSASGKRIAQTVGLDEFSIGRSEVGLTDPQVVMLAKAINERLVIGYEQGLQSAANAVKATVSISRYWSVTAYGGTFDGVDLLYTRRFDRLHW